MSKIGCFGAGCWRRKQTNRVSPSTTSQQQRPNNNDPDKKKGTSNESCPRRQRNNRVAPSITTPPDTKTKKSSDTSPKNTLPNALSDIQYKTPITTWGLENGETMVVDKHNPETIEDKWKRLVKFELWRAITLIQHKLFLLNTDHRNGSSLVIITKNKENFDEITVKIDEKLDNAGLVYSLKLLFDPIDGPCAIISHIVDLILQKQKAKKEQLYIQMLLDSKHKSDANYFTIHPYSQVDTDVFKPCGHGKTHCFAASFSEYLKIKRSNRVSGGMKSRTAHKTHATPRSQSRPCARRVVKQSPSFTHPPKRTANGSQ